jgi:cyclophilin family peptidyl-prolyl cis-trans isomerase
VSDAQSLQTLVWQAPMRSPFATPAPARRRLTFAVCLLLTLAACSRASWWVPAPLTEAADPRFAAVSPDSFDVEMVTTKGLIVLRARRAWSPHGVDRLYALTRNNYFDSVAFHRAIRGFVAQFGIHGDTAVSRTWRGRTIPDDSVRVVNQRGTLAFARAGPNTRSVQLFFNLVDNTPRLDTLNGFGFPPVAQVIAGLEVMDTLNTEYSSPGAPGPAPDQGALNREGNAYLRREYPRLDYIVTARVVRTWPAGARSR